MSFIFPPDSAIHKCRCVVMNNWGNPIDLLVEAVQEEIPFYGSQPANRVLRDVEVAIEGIKQISGSYENAYKDIKAKKSLV